MHGKDKILSDMYSDTKSFQVKLKPLHKHVNEQRFDHFLCCKIVGNGIIQITSYWETKKMNFLNIIENL